MPNEAQLKRSGAAKQRHYSVSEYLKLEQRTGERYEYFAGKPKLMPGGSPTHNRISVNIISELQKAIKARQAPYYVFGSDQKIYLPHYEFFVYPDAVVVVEKPLFSDNDATAIINPILIVEVLSPSTEEYNKGGKFLEYKSLDSFKEYCLIRQDAPEVSTFFREEVDLWRDTIFSGAEAVAQFRLIDVSISLSDIYYNAEL